MEDDDDDNTPYIRIKLDEYQSQAVEWILVTEDFASPVPFWKTEENGTYISEVTGKRTAIKPRAFAGGIYNDQKGINMVPNLLYVICLDLEFHTRATTLVLLDSAEEWKDCIMKYATEELNFLVVGEDIDFEELRYLYDSDMGDYHLILAFYHQLQSGFDFFQSKKWHRVILYDAHSPLAPSLCKEFSLLYTERKWVVTHKRIIQKYMYFIFSFFNPTELKLVEQLLNETSNKRRTQFEQLVKPIAYSITKRRTTKVDLGILPPLDEENRCIELFPEDKKKSGMIEEEVIVTLIRLIRCKDKEPHQVPSLLADLLTFIPGLRQLDMCTMKALLDHHRNKFQEYVSKGRETIVMELQNGGLNCPVCCSKLTGPALVTICGHVFCQICIRKALAFNPNCPVCRHPASSENDLFSIAPPDIGPESSSAIQLSSKVNVLLDLLREHKLQNGKAVVFSLFPKLLSFLETILTDAGFETMGLYQENVDASYKNWVIEHFKSEEVEKPMIVLVSIEAARNKFDLKAASTVFLMEACKHRAEKYAIKCVQQIGKKERIRVVRIMAKIEEKILTLHELNLRPSESEEKWCADHIEFNEMAYILGQYSDDS